MLIVAAMIVCIFLCMNDLYAQGLDDLLKGLDDQDLTAQEKQPDEGPAQPVSQDAMTVEPVVEEPAQPDIPVAPVVGSNQVDPGEQNILSVQERMRRDAHDLMGRQRMDFAEKAMESKKWDDAIEHYNSAKQLLLDRPANDDRFKKIEARLAEAFYYKAWEALQENKFDEANKNIEDSLKSSPTNSIILELDETIEKAKTKWRREAHARKTKEMMDNIKIKHLTIDDLIIRGKQLMTKGEYDLAEESFDQVLIQDPYHKNAMRLLKNIEQRKYKISTLLRKKTQDDMMEDVRLTWSPPVRVETSKPTQQSLDPVPEGEKESDLIQKMKNITIPSIDFRLANIVDVVEFLVDASRSADQEGDGVNIILHLGSAVSAAAPAKPANETDFFGDGFLMEDTPPESNAGDLAGMEDVPPITLSLKRVTLFDAIKYVTEVSGLKYRVEENVVIITLKDMSVEPLLTRFYPIQPSVMEMLIETKEAEGGGEFGGALEASNVRQKQPIRQLFEELGVKFPDGSSILYRSQISKIFLRNTADNIEVFERVLTQLNVIPSQIEIETRFVEVKQDDLEELGLEWILTDHWEIATRKGDGPLSSRERIQVNANQNEGGFTQGVRFMHDLPSGIGPQNRGASGANPMLGSIFNISSVLTNPELNLVIHALQQKGGTDVLSAPRVTAKSGETAEIRVVEEIIYPTEFNMEAQEIGTGGTGDQGRTVVVVVPGGFEMRETGVILVVNPTVSPDGYTIDLTMAPEVAELIDWIDYGSQGYEVWQPIFSSRRVATRISIWDGQTVVMGGLIKEKLVKVDDKIPLLGDIPLVGRLFGNKGEYSEKANLMMFVTARIVDPAGEMINKQDSSLRDELMMKSE